MRKHYNTCIIRFKSETTKNLFVYLNPNKNNAVRIIITIAVRSSESLELNEIYSNVISNNGKLPHLGPMDLTTTDASTDYQSHGPSRSDCITHHRTQNTNAMSIAR